jgi:cbb3-type cytochrome oxidase maturation protein
MSVLFIVVPIAIILAAIGVAACIWAIRQGQYDDSDTPAARILFEDDDPTGPGEKLHAPPPLGTPTQPPAPPPPGAHEPSRSDR